MPDEFLKFACTMASNTSLTNEVDVGYAWRHAYIEIPALASSSTLHMQVANSSGGTYRRLMYEPFVQSAVVLASMTFQVHSTVTNSVVPIPGGFRFMKFETVDSMAGGVLYNVLVGE